jgi:hypothetical protein
LRLLPDFISQHRVAERRNRYFFEVRFDHGTDISLNIDNMPINMVSHAHGQGYADSHFIIPETISNLNFEKGPITQTKETSARPVLANA